MVSLELLEQEFANLRDKANDMYNNAKKDINKVSSGFQQKIDANKSPRNKARDSFISKIDSFRKVNLIESNDIQKKTWKITDADRAEDVTGVLLKSVIKPYWWNDPEFTWYNSQDRSLSITKYYCDPCERITEKKLFYKYMTWEFFLQDILRTKAWDWKDTKRNVDKNQNDKITNENSINVFLKEFKEYNS